MGKNADKTAEPWIDTHAGNERGFGEILVLTAMFSAWYGTNIMFNM